MTDSVSCIYKIKTCRDQRGDPLPGKGRCCQARGPEFHFWDPHGRRRVLRVILSPPHAHHDTDSSDTVALFLLKHTLLRWISPTPQATLKGELVKASTKIIPPLFFFSLCFWALLALFRSTNMCNQRTRKLRHFAKA